MEEGCESVRHWAKLSNSRTSCSGVYNIEYKLYICIYMIFCKIKKQSCWAEPALRVEATAQTSHDARAGLAQALLNGSCLGPASQTRPIWPSIPLHDNDGPRLSCHHLVHHSTSFLSPLMPPSPHPILGRGRRSRRLLSVFVRHQHQHRLP
jgi:hypothetical protein